MKHTENFKGFVNERMVKPSRGHNYYVLNKDVPVKYIASQSNPTGATGVLLHNKKGYIDGKEGAFIIDYFGGHYYVDMENQFASYIYKLKDQDRGFRDALTEVDEAPEHADWRDFMREIPFENNSSMRHLKNYSGFLNEGANDDYAYSLHAMTGCGQSAAKDFLDENEVDVEKLIRDIQNGTINKWDASRGIRGVDHPIMMKKFNRNYVKK